VKTKTRKILDDLWDNLLYRCNEVMLRRCPECGKDYEVRDVINLKGYDLKKELILDDFEKQLNDLHKSDITSASCTVSTFTQTN
jgi:hypothetical protein